MISIIVSVLTLAAAVVGAPRWLRIAQREHYIAGSVTRFALRWWLSTLQNRVIGGALLASICIAWAGWWEGAAAAGIICLIAPLGLSYRGRTSKLAWTRRLRTIAAVGLAFFVVIAISGALTGYLAAFAATLAALTPAVTDLALAATAPLERHLSAKFMDAATSRLNNVSPRVVAITGSFGKTSTKFYVGHLLRAKYVTVTSPASYNNKTGLSRAINERLTPGTEIFVAEMGTYGRGEIRTLCDWLHPEISVITALGPVHLERMGSIENIARAKAEILEHAKVGIVNIDNPRLAAVATDYKRKGGKLITCSATSVEADVSVVADQAKLVVSVHGNLVEVVNLPGVFPGNVACAVAVAIAADVPLHEIASRLATLPRPEHRQAVQPTANGITVIDDTYNSNPDGALKALATLASAATGNRKAVVTPGMVELGREQAKANEIFAQQAAAIATDIIVVGRTNRRALLRGASTGAAHVTICTDRSQAVAWVRSNLSDGDAVLYENDLPDHYP